MAKKVKKTRAEILAMLEDAETEEGRTGLVAAFLDSEKKKGK